MGRKLEGSAPFWGGEAGSPSNTISLGSRPTFLQSDTLFHRVIVPQQIWAENEGAVPFGEGDLGPNLTQYDTVRGLPACQVSS